MLRGAQLRFQQDSHRHLQHCIAQGFVDFAQQSELISYYSQTSQVLFVCLVVCFVLFCSKVGQLSGLFYSISTDKQISRQTDSKSKPK